MEEKGEEPGRERDEGASEGGKGRGAVRSERDEGAGPGAEKESEKGR